MRATHKQPATIQIAPGLFVPPEITVTSDDYRGYRVEATVIPDGGRLVVSCLTVCRLSDGAPVTGEGLRQIALTPFVKTSLLAAYAKLAARPHDAPSLTLDELLRVGDEGAVAWGLLNVADRDRLKAAGPIDETLQWVALLYRVAVVVAEPPVKSVQGAFEVSLRTATNWVAAARGAGYLNGADQESPGGDEGAEDST
jgi:hypothetical protein